MITAFNNYKAFDNYGNHLQDVLTSKHVVDSFGSVYTPGFLTNDITNMFNPATTFDTFYFKNSNSFLITSLQYVVNSSTEDFFIGLHSYSHLHVTDLTLGSYYALLQDTFTGILAEPNPKLCTVSSKLIQELLFLTGPKTEAFNLIKVIPEHETSLGLFEVISVNVDNSLYNHLHMPDVKLYYPEPYIASPSFVHEEVWFLHILHFQHWLWFFFISLIMFFFITFINVVRWCNPRAKPKRETRGVSRSKCADLITACVPVSWALSIIVSESVDAADYYDGFGTGEIVVGIRAYQWGWEYFFPKNIDLNYNVSPTYSSLTGNSLKYTKTQGLNYSTNHFWKGIRLKTQNRVESVPTHILLAPVDNAGVLNFMDFNSLGSTTLNLSAAFKKVQQASKTTSQDLLSSHDNFALKYNKLYDLYLSDTSAQGSLGYGISRQHGYSANTSIINGSLTNLDAKSVSKLLSYNYNYGGNSPSLGSADGLGPTQTNPNLITNTTFVCGTLTTNHEVNFDLSKFKTLLTLEGDISSKSLASFGHLPVQPLTNKLNYGDNTFDCDFFYKKFTPKPLDRKVVPVSRFGGKSAREGSIQVRGDSHNPGNPNLSKADINFTNNYYGNLLGTQCLGGGVDTVLASTPTAITQSHTPSSVLGTKLTTLRYDRFAPTGVSSPLLGLEGVFAPGSTLSSFWVSLWSTNGVGVRLAPAVNYLGRRSNLALPAIIEYAEYDFRDWVALESLEDLLWESNLSSYAQDEYVSILRDVTTLNYTGGTYNINRGSFFVMRAFPSLSQLVQKMNKPFEPEVAALGGTATPLIHAYPGTYPAPTVDTLYNNMFMLFPFLPSKPALKDLVSPLPLFSEEGRTSARLTPLTSFGVYDNVFELSSSGNPYGGNKFTNYIHHLNCLNTRSTHDLGARPLSYTQVLNLFRANYGESVLCAELFIETGDTTGSELLTESDYELRSHNHTKLRSTARNAIGTFNALQKVFRSRFDEGRSNVRPQDISNNYVKHPHLSEPRVLYESLLGKNKRGFFGASTYKTSVATTYSTLSPVLNSLNIYFSSIPFLLSIQSDAGRHLWFDWYSRWSSVEVQPSSIARYSLLGVPYPNKYFEYNTQSGNEVRDSETYLTRLSKARKNYIPNWALTPYLHSRVSNWYTLNNYVNQAFNNPSVLNLSLILELSSGYWLNNGTNTPVNNSTTSLSDISTPGRSSWKPLSGLQAYSYNLSTLADILTRREYLYREYFLNQNFTINLPKYLLSSPTNTLYQEIKKSYPLADPSTFTTEISRDFFYENTNLFRFNILKNLLVSTSSVSAQGVADLTDVINYSFPHHPLSTIPCARVGSSDDLLMNQFRPLRKGVSNMIRLHATGAIAMPIEIRLHILASSKDIIHSWAIPSAGVKIDCIPGYSSHRVAIFLVSGIFWGQCMEICGRFHHWMPIIVYFMKKDLFFLWCTHFIHFSPNDSSFSTSGKEYSSKLKPASLDPALWVSGAVKFL